MKVCRDQEILRRKLSERERERRRGEQDRGSENLMLEKRLVRGRNSNSQTVISVFLQHKSNSEVMRNNRHEHTFYFLENRGKK